MHMVMVFLVNVLYSCFAFLLTVFWRQSEVVVQKLSKLHDHVREPGVGDVVVRVVLLRDPPGAWQRGRAVSAPGHRAAVGVGVG
jgi:hypothetical protein